MNRKILIGSLIAVTVLVGVSFTNVIGFQSVKTSYSDSPLFNVRISRAIEEESKGLVCRYVGEGKNINLLIPNRNDEIISIKKLIEKINRMDDKTINELIQEYHFIRNHPDILEKYPIGLQEYELLYPTIEPECPIITTLVSNYTKGARPRPRQARLLQASPVHFPFVAAKVYNYPDALILVVYASSDAIFRRSLFDFSPCKFDLILPCLILSLAPVPRRI